MTETRIEYDTMGPVEVPQEALWGAQTQRALGTGIALGRLPWGLISALTLIKKGAARINAELGLISAEIGRAIEAAADEVIAEGSLEHFPLSPFQTGSGTSTNMNVNEVLANRANELLGGRRGAKSPVHPNDHVNRCQSSNDVFPTAIHLAAARALCDELVPATDLLERGLREKSEEFRGVVKLGRTHLMDAVPVTLGQEFGAYARMIELGAKGVAQAGEGLRELALGGTAVGTGLNAHPEFASRVVAWLALETKIPFVRAENTFEAMSSKGRCVAVSGALKNLGVGLSKIANDLRWMASGPHGGLAEIRLPELQPGSSIMPGKVNPVVPESVMQATAQVVADDLAVTQAGMGGAFELNLMMPLLAGKLIEQILLLAGACRLLFEKCVDGIAADPKRCRALLEGSLALATPLAETIGYEATARIVALARSEGISLLAAALRLGVSPEDDLRKALDPDRMARGL